MGKTTALILCVSLFLLVQTITWFQLNGQFFSEWFKNNNFILALFGIPISYLYICHIFAEVLFYLSVPL